MTAVRVIAALWMTLACAAAGTAGAQGPALAERAEDVEAQFENAIARLHQAAQGGRADAYEKLVALARQNVAAAQFRLGQLHYEPEPASRHTRSLGEALDWWEKASAQGYGRASLALANLYDRGESGIAADPARALRLYELSIAQGWVNPTSQTRLARALLRNGRATDCPRIASLLQAAAAAGFAEAAQLLAGDGGFKTLCRP